MPKKEETKGSETKKDSEDVVFSISKENVWKIVAVVLAVALIGVLYINSSPTTPSGGETTTVSPGVAETTLPYTGERAKVVFYVMSQCPYGTQVVDAIKPVLDQFGSSVDFKIEYIANENSDGSFSSLHGQQEVNEDIRQLCARKHNPDKYMNYILCINADYSNADQVWESCASKAGLDLSAMKSCYSGSEGTQLLSASVKASQAANAMGSPTMYFNDQLYEGERDALSFTRAICQGIPNHELCKNIPVCISDSDCVKTGFSGICTNAGTTSAACTFEPLPTINIIVLNDKTCDGCDTSQLDDVNKQMFVNVNQKNIDISSEEGKNLLSQLNITQLPAYLFDSTIEKSPIFDRTSSFLIKQEGYYILDPRVISSYVPGPKFIGRAEEKNTLDLFVMSQCPYGTIAENNMKDVLALFGSKLKFNLYFIANQNEDGSFSSLHGQGEVDEDTRQVCAMKYNPDKYFNYVLCVDKDYSNAANVWENCAKESGLDVAKIKACAGGSEGTELLAANIQKANDLGIGSSPTFFINNQVLSSGAMSPEQIKANVCEMNKDLEGCSVTLNTTSGTVTPTASGGSCG